MKYTVRKDTTDYKINETMERLGRESASISRGQVKDLENILEGLGIELDYDTIWLATKNDIIWLSIHLVSLGKIYGREEANIQKG